jgi:hypothetical protein
MHAKRTAPSASTRHARRRSRHAPKCGPTAASPSEEKVLFFNGFQVFVGTSAGVLYVAAVNELNKSKTHKSLRHFNRNAFRMTEIDESAIAAAAMIGETRPNAHNGIAKPL